MISTFDKGQPPQSGGWLTARYGKGTGPTSPTRCTGSCRTACPGRTGLRRTCWRWERRRKRLRPERGANYELSFSFLAFRLTAASLALAFAMAAINFAGTGSDRGNRIVPLSLTSYEVDCRPSDATS